MPVRQIITYENPRLRKKSIKIKRIDADLQTLIDDMLDTMRAAEGIGLAAPQVGVLLRVIVMEYTEGDSDEINQVVLINPEISERQGEWLAEEGCLSIPGYTGTVPRAERVTVRGKDRHGKDVKLKAEGLFAHIVQHETDHLDGVLYIDYITDPDELKVVEPGSKKRRRRGAATEGAEPTEPAEGDQPDQGSAAVPSPPREGGLGSGGAPPVSAGGAMATASIWAEDPTREACCDICGHA